MSTSKKPAVGRKGRRVNRAEYVMPRFVDQLSLALRVRTPEQKDEALAFAANVLGRRGLSLEAGQVVLTGGMTDAVFAPPGAAIALHFTSLGSIFLTGGPS